MGATLADEVGDMIEQAIVALRGAVTQVTFNEWAVARDAAAIARVQIQTIYVVLDAAAAAATVAERQQADVAAADARAGWTQARYHREIMRITQALEGLIMQGLSGDDGILDEGITALRDERRNLERGLVALRADRKATGQLVGERGMG